MFWIFILIREEVALQTSMCMKFRIFISSVQREFARERRQLAEYIRKDVVFSKFFDVFLFEEIPADDVSPKAVYLKEVAKSDIYLGLIGREYGFEDAVGVSPTEREYDCAGEHNKPRFVFVKKLDVRTPKEQCFLEKVESERVRKTFPNLKSLKEAVAATLVRFLEEHRKIQTGPFDSSVCEGASLKDLSTVKMRDFIRVARERRGFKLPVSTSAKDLLAHLDLMREDGRLTNAAVLLFGKKPQRYFINSEVKCAWFYGTRVEKPMADHQIYQGDVFQLADQARDFVMSHISREIGRHNGPMVPLRLVTNFRWTRYLNSLSMPFAIGTTRVTKAYRSCFSATGLKSGMPDRCRAAGRSRISSDRIRRFRRTSSWRSRCTSKDTSKRQALVRAM